MRSNTFLQMIKIYWFTSINHKTGVQFVIYSPEQSILQSASNREPKLSADSPPASDDEQEHKPLHRKPQSLQPADAQASVHISRRSMRCHRRSVIEPFRAASQ
jgi:hypothetical protein